MQQQPYDLIVVGTGTAGAILAARIAQHGVNPRTGEPLKIASMTLRGLLRLQKNREGL